jgi:beta-lactam-binding protein with PASTA domain
MPIVRRSPNEPPTAAPPAPDDPGATQPLHAPAPHDAAVQEYAPPPRAPRIWPWLLALVVLLALGIGLGLGYGLMRGDSSAGASATTTAPAPGRVTVPNVVGQRADRAASRLVGAGLKISFRRQLSTQQSGTVLSQEPAASSSAAAGSTVVLTIARGTDTAGVPAVVGLPLAQALAKLRAAGLQASETRVAGPQPAGQVIAQSPHAGRRAPRGSKVQIKVSSGRANHTTTTTTGETPGSPVPAKVEIPDVVGMTLAQARATLSGASLRADPKPVPSTQPKNTVVAQYPAAGEPAKHGGSVRVNISQGPTGKAVPDVVGEDETTATTKLQNAGFDVKVVRQDTTDPAEDGVVLDETPAGGETAKPGAKITITVGSLTSG